ncbi:MAG TPA: hypothetical protein EYP23_03680 [Thermoplasmata archaeon]|nr:hypothetical protein [Thermoplasmata archaeon]
MKVTVDLINFTLLKSGAAPYFIIYAYDNYTVTPTVTVNYNETVSLDDAYDLLNADIYDDLGGDTFNVRISALDKNSQTEEGRDASLAINGSNYVWQINYNITNPQQVFSLTGNDGVLKIKIMIIRE